MEPTVEKLETRFLKSEADLEYIERRLKLDFINSAAVSGCSAEVVTHSFHFSQQLLPVLVGPALCCLSSCC
ncbi:hypothetical protein AMECASPLE_022653 [Ameca splendens]|uniref:Uncharacterized protein n=1 Tax=Ameca splendens TaxID=208324 RepID=A0ABV0XGV7_9TELE